MEKFFKLKENKTNVRTEIIAGFTTFFTMAYIIFVNPDILSITGMNWNGVFVATILAAAIGTLVMGLFANIPYALAPGMGLNAFFTYNVCATLGFKWQEAMAMVLISGIVNTIITVTKVRKSILKSIPSSLQNAIGGGIGIFIAYIGIKNAGFLTFTADPNTYSNFDGTIVANASIVPALDKFNTVGPIVALIGLIIMVLLVLLKVKGSIFIGIILTTIVGAIFGIVTMPDKIVDVAAIGDIKETAFSMFGDVGFASMFSDAGRILFVVLATFAFCLSDTFDTIGTFIGTGRVSGIFDEQDEKRLMEGNSSFDSKIEKGLFADVIATTFGALLGTSNTTTYVESAAGISEGGRTGLTSVVVSVLFLLCLPFAGLFGMVPAQATAPALIVVGIMMMSSFSSINWTDFEESTPAFMTVVIMSFAFNISYGIAAGFIFYCVIKIAKNKFNQIHPILLGATGLFVINFVIVALQAAGIIQ